ncbi:hypothetical protein PILCRDRAFT_816264 [Piloderma croceum F 1598]|uniref:Uncharacterized protein n=1 Tax=Piloderma croceum (strain F 1598) TaxID=765440 RepID=A0A0C3FQC5_PILCF|nr:hypothetical protein PILCRDRAFT_816264 [Piloderma croceum F 1598]
MSASKLVAQQTHQPSSPSDSKNGPSEPELLPPTYQSQSTTSLPATPSTSNASATRITFAPLPPIEPRKRRSTSQIRLGVSARSSMVRRRRPALENFRSEGREEGWGGVLPKSPSSSEAWQDEQTEYPRANKQRDGSTDAEDPFLAMSRMVKSAWRRVAHAQTQSQSTQPNGSGHEQEQEANQSSLEKERKMGLDCEKNSLYTQEESLTAKQVPSDKEEGVGALGKAPIRSSSLKFKKPVLVRSASEPWGNSVASTFNER